jgi:hypothetical protein
MNIMVSFYEVHEINAWCLTEQIFMKFVIWGPY